MKKTYSLALISGFLIMGFACTNLEVEPESLTTSDLVFEEPESYRAFLARVYAGLAVSGQIGPSGDPDIQGIDEGFSNYIRQLWKAQELTTDEAVIAWGDEGLPDYHEHDWTASNQFVTAMYNRIFYQVSISNEFLRETSDALLSERGVSDALRADINQYRAEARFLRALSYWHGIDLYGDIPFYTEEDAIGTAAPEQASREEIFQFVEEELLAIVDQLSAPRQGEYGRADQGAVWALLAKLYLNAEIYTGNQRYADCITYCNRVINLGAYQLDPVYQHLFLADNNTSEEIIFPITFDGERTQTFGGMTFVIHAAVGGEMDPANYGIDGGWFGTRTTSALVNLFPDETGETDNRAIFYTEGQTKEIESITNFTDGYAVPKYENITSTGTPGSDATFPDTDFPMFRLADIYLMYAEAVLRGGGGDVATAVTYVNDIRNRAYEDESGTLTANGLTLDFILNERARELYWEGHRRTDLIRFNQFTENGIWPWKGGVPAGRTTEAYRNLFPIPASDLLANPSLEQNDGY